MEHWFIPGSWMFRNSRQHPRFPHPIQVAENRWESYESPVRIWWEFPEIPRSTQPGELKNLVTYPVDVETQVQTLIQIHQGTQASNPVDLICSTTLPGELNDSDQDRLLFLKIINPGIRRVETKSRQQDPEFPWVNPESNLEYNLKYSYNIYIYS